jgi:flagellar FliL protein
LKNAPTFVPLDPFTVNLADRNAERYAQVGMTLELTNAKAGELLKAYMPAIRNNILLVLAAKNAGELMEHDGKVQLAAEVRAAALKPLGYTLADEAAAAPAGKGKQADTEHPEDQPPIRAVHFSNFIIQ